MHGVGCENLSKSGTPKRIGITLAGIVIHRQTVDQGFSDIRNFSFAEFASGGFPNILPRVSKGPAKQASAVRVVRGKRHFEILPRKEAGRFGKSATAQSETDTGGPGIGCSWSFHRSAGRRRGGML